MSIIDQALNNPDENEAIIQIEEYLTSRFDSDQSSLSNIEKNVIYIENLEREVNNGGIDQFFSNSSGNYAHETVTALEEIGAQKTSDLLKKAISVFPDGDVPKDREKRREVMEEIEDDSEDTWNELDDKFYEYEDDIPSLILSYIRSNRKEFK